ncbi:unnamed protein product [Caenorhabditis nigoni]
MKKIVFAKQDISIWNEMKQHRKEGCSQTSSRSQWENSEQAMAFFEEVERRYICNASEVQPSLRSLL